MAKFTTKAKLITALNLDPLLERERNFLMEYHEVAGKEMKLIKALRDLDAVKDGRTAWKENEWCLIEEKGE